MFQGSQWYGMLMLKKGAYLWRTISLGGYACPTFLQEVRQLHHGYELTLQQLSGHNREYLN